MWSSRASSRAVTHLLPESVAAKCLFCLYVNITSQCRILNVIFVISCFLFFLFFLGGGSFNDTKADNITLPSLFSLWEKIFQRAAMCEFVTVCDYKMNKAPSVVELVISKILNTSPLSVAFYKVHSYKAKHSVCRLNNFFLDLLIHS